MFGTLAVIIIILEIFSRIWTNYLWYKEVGYTSVFWTPFLAKLGVGAFFGLVFFAFFFGNLRLARRLSPRFVPVTGEGNQEVLELVRRPKWRDRLLLGLSLVAAVIMGAAYSGKWETVLLFLNRTPFGYSDPLFGKDASFFVFTLPLWSMLVNFVGLLVLLTLVVLALVYLLQRALTIDNRRRLRLAPHVKAHLSALLALAMLAKAADYLLQSWELVYSTRGVTFGASYTDVHASLPVLRFLAVVALIAAALFLVNVRYRGWRLPMAAILVMLLTWVFAGKAYPAIVQQYRVTPNEIAAESKYIQYNLEATRWAFGLSNLIQLPYPATTDLTPQELARYAATTENVRLWEPRPALSTYSQIQEIRLYYAFNDVDVDRYVVNGKYREVLVSARELDQEQLQEQSKTWVNRHLVYTHGYGLVMSPVNEAAPDGLPVLFISNIPPASSIDLKVTRPEIYYGELGNEFVVVKTATKEFDYPSGDTNVFSTYQGAGGIPVGSWLRKLAFSVRFGSLKLLLSDALTQDSRIMFRRTIKERVQALAPFLVYDRDPYLVLRPDGTLVWMWDAYTTSSRFPYSQPHANNINYIRGAVKAVIDAYDGTVTFYQVDASDPLAKAWSKIFGGLFVSGDQMPADLRAHMRYPEDLFSIQASVLATYHMTDPQIFYNKEDVWEIPYELYGAEEIPVAPYYQVLALPGETNAEFVLLQPFSPLTKKNMTAILVARQDGQHYGKLLVLTLPKDKLVYGPAQVEARISNDPAISSQLTLWDQAGSRVIRGNLLVVPIGRSIVYFEPVYLQAEQSPIPELTRVIVAYGEQVVMEPTVKEALAKVFGQSPAGETTSTSSGSSTTPSPPGTTTATGSSTTTTTTSTPSGPGSTTTPEISQLIELAAKHYDAALEAQRRGDWAKYGEEISKLGQVLEQLTRLTR
ncbi:MAG: UPF0182 family protein [Thermoleophilia bacterium]|nr:UPF0182 family protein [Thermoleophilia bacterium]